MKSSRDAKYESILAEFKNILKENRLKYTGQRELILRVLYDSKYHLTPEDLFSLVKEKFPDSNIGIATIYRTLNLLEENSVVNSITFGKFGKKYELDNKPHHDHIICDICGKIIEFEDEQIEKRQIEIANEHNFKITSHIMQLHGICEECQKKSKEEEKN